MSHKILIVDDQEVNRKLLKVQLHAEGFNTVEASDGQEALGLLKKQKVDAIISDILMPRMDGYRLCYEVRKDPRLKALPFIFYTATYTSPADEKLAAEAGGDKYLKKPASIRDIIQAIQDLTAGKEPRVGRRPVPVKELHIMKKYSEVLVNKLEEKNEEIENARQKLLLQNEKLQQAGMEVQRNLERIRALHEIDVAISSTLDLRTVLNVLLEKIELFLPIAAASTVRLLNRETGVLESLASRGLDEEEWKAQDSKSVGGRAKMIVETKAPLTVRNVQTDPQTHNPEIFRKYGLVSHLGVPLIAKDEAIGVLGLYTKEEHEFSAEEIEFLSTLAGQAAIAINNAQLYQESQQNLERICALREIDRAISSTLDLRAVLDILMEKIDLVLPYSATTIRLFNPKSGLLEPVACRNLDEKEWKLEQWKAGRGPANEAFETKVPLMIPNCYTDTRVRDPGFFRKHSLVSYLGVPMVAKEEILGVLSFYTKEEHEYNAEEIEFLSTLAGQAAIAINNAQLYESANSSRKELELTNQYLERSLKQLSGLYTALTPLTLSESIQEMMDGVIERLIEATGADAALIRLRDEKTDTYQLAAERGFPEYYFKAVNVSRVGGAADWVCKNGEPIIAPDIALEPRFKGKIQLEVGLRSCVMLPLKVHDEVRGIIHLSSRKLGYFDEEQRDHLIAITRQMSIALENRELFDNLKASKDELEKALKVKDEFLSVMSHELRTPLNVVVGYTGMIMDGLLGEISPQQKEALGKVINRANDELAIVNNILYATVLDTEKINVESQVLVLGDFLNQLKSTYDTPLHKELILNWECSSPLSVIHTDGAKLKHILQNLIDNAFKFTPRGEVKISAGISSAPLLPGSPAGGQGDGGARVSYVEFKVADTGVGIPKEHLPFIFDKFRQADSSETRSFGGVGMGLYIVKKFTELLGGTVGVESEVGKGTIFTVSLPCGQ